MAKTAEKVTAPKEVVQLLDTELVRQLRIDRASKLWPGVQKVDALLRSYESLQELHDKNVQDLLNLSGALEEAADKLVSYANDITSLEQEHAAVTTANQLLVEQIRKLGDFIIETVPGEPSENEGAVDTAIRLLRSIYTARAAEVPMTAEFHATALPSTLPPHCGSVLRIVPEVSNAL